MKAMLRIILMTLILLVWSCEKESDPEPVQSVPDLAEIELAELALKQPDLETSKSMLNAKFRITKSKSDVLDLVNGGAIVGKATLFRGQNGLFLLYYTDALIPYHAYTIWWGIWNNPESCVDPTACGTNDADFANFAQTEPELMYATGKVARHNGKALFWAFLGTNNNTGSVNHLFGLPSSGGLLNPEGSLIYAIVRSHGPAVPGIIDEQIGTYLGGCPTTFPYGFPPFTEIPDEVGECGDIYEALFLP